MLDVYRKSYLVSNYKNKGDVQDQEDYRGIKLMSYTTKVWKKVIQKRLREDTTVPKTNSDLFGRSTMESIFYLK